MGFRTNVTTGTRVLCVTLCLSVAMAGACGGNPPNGPAPTPAESARGGETTETRTSALLPGVNQVSLFSGGVGIDTPWAHSLDDIAEVLKDATAVAGAIADWAGAIQAVLVVAQLLGILGSSNNQLQELTQHLDAIGLNISWQIMAAYIDEQYNKLLGPLNDITDNPSVLFQGSTGDMNSREGVSGLTLSSAWHRAAIGSGNDSATDGGSLSYPTHDNFWPNTIPTWKDVLHPSPPGTSVFDWRMGAPFLLKALASRLVIMGHAQPDFRTNHSYDDELSDRRQDLLYFYDTISNGLQCASKNYHYFKQNGSPGSSSFTAWGCMIVCADVHTGLAALSAFTPTPPAAGQSTWPNTIPHDSVSPFGPAVVTAKCENVAGTADYINLWNTTAELVRRKLPLFKMRQMIDRLYNILNPGPDLTAETGRIRPSLQGNLCLSVQNGSATPGTPLQLAPCVGSAAQTWRYDRQTGQIVNPALGTCVDQRWSLTTGTDIDTWPCEQPQGSPPAITNLAQMWSYDRETGRLQGALGQLMHGRLAASDDPQNPLGFFSKVVTGANSGMGFYPVTVGPGWRADTPLEIATFRNLDGKLETFYTGNNQVLFRRMQTATNGGSWNGGLLNASWNAAKKVAVGENQDRRLEVFYIGTNDVLLHTWQNTAGGSIWSGEFLLAGSGDRAKQLVVDRNLNGELEVIFIGVDGVLRRIAQVSPNSSWRPVSLFAGPTTKAKQIALGANEDGRLELIFTGADDVLYRSAQASDGRTWGAPVHLNASFNAAKKVALARNLDGRLEAFYIGTNDVLFHTWQNSGGGGAWSGEHHLITGTNKAKQLAVARNADGRLEAIYTGMNDVLYHAWQHQAGQGWSGEFPLDAPDRRAHRLTVGQNLGGALAVTFAGMNGVLYVMQQAPGGTGWGAPVVLP
jgi:hypothetical protein